MKKNPNYKILPQSEKIYRKYYKEFEEKRLELNINSIDEALTKVFEIWSFDFSAATLSTRLSAICKILKFRKITYDDNTYDNIVASISNMKKNSNPPKTALTFTKENFVEYLRFDHSNSLKLLQKKVILIIGTILLLRGEEFRTISKGNIEVKDDGISVTFLRKKTSKDMTTHKGWIPRIVFDVDVLSIINDYLSKLANDNNDSPLFKKINKSDTQFENSVIGKNQFSYITKFIAEDLHLSDSEKYTTHSLRRSGATLFTELGVSVEELQILGNWKSADIACHYVNHSDQARKRISEKAFSNPESKRTTTSCNFGNGSYIFNAPVTIYNNSPGNGCQVETFPFLPDITENPNIAQL